MLVFYTMFITMKRLMSRMRNVTMTLRISMFMIIIRIIMVRMNIIMVER